MRLDGDVQAGSMTATPMHSDSSGTWMTKAELARARGITLGSADRLIRKQRWRRQPGNDGKVRALIPPGWENPDPRGEPTDDPTDDPRAVGMSSLAAGALTALEDAVSALREQLERAEAGRVEERQRADRAEARADDLRAQIDVLNAELVVMRAEADRQLAEERGVKAGVLINASRAALTGQPVGPSAFAVFTCIGRGRVRGV